MATAFETAPLKPVADALVAPCRKARNAKLHGDADDVPCDAIGDLPRAAPVLGSVEAWLSLAKARASTRSPSGTRR